MMESSLNKLLLSLGLCLLLAAMVSAQPGHFEGYYIDVRQNLSYIPDNWATYQGCTTDLLQCPNHYLASLDGVDSVIATCKNKVICCRVVQNKKTVPMITAVLQRDDFSFNTMSDWHSCNCQPIKLTILYLLDLDDGSGDWVTRLQDIDVGAMCDWNKVECRKFMC